VDSQLQQPNAPRASLSGAELPNPPSAEIYACWNKIGVYGDSTCAELPQFVHLGGAGDPDDQAGPRTDHDAA